MTSSNRKPIFAIAVFHNAGDILCCTPVAKQLKTEYPDCHITWFTSEAHRLVLENNPYIDEVVAIGGDPWALDKRIPELKMMRPWDRFFTPAPYMNYAARPGAPLFDLIKAGAGLKWTVPFIPILRLTQEEIQQAHDFLYTLPSGKKILVETEYNSQQSHWHDGYAWDMLEMLKPCDPFFIFSSFHKPPFFDRFFADYPKACWCSLPLRINAEIFNRCDAFIGVSSGISAVCLSDYCRTDMPRIEVSRGEHWSASAYPHLSELQVCFSRNRFQEALANLSIRLSGARCSPLFTPRSRPVEMLADGRERCACLTCGSGQSTPERGNDIVRCKDCGLVFLRDRPSAPDSAAQQPEPPRAVGPCAAVTVADLPVSIAAIDSVPAHIAAQQRELLDRISVLSNGGLEGKQLIDIGCGWGAFMFNARKRGMKVTGFELSPPQVLHGRKLLGLDIRQEPFDEAKTDEASADVIIMSHSLEHMRHPFETLEKVQFTLTTDGLLACRVPNFEGLCSRALKNQWPWIDRKGNYAYFGPQTLRDMLIQAGFDIERCVTRSGDFGTRTPLDILRRLKPNAPAAELKRILAQVELSGQGEEIQVVARKRGSSKCRYQQWPCNDQKPDAAPWMPHIVIDGVIFQLQHKRPLGIARVWQNLLPAMIKALPEARFTIVERRGFPVPLTDCPRVTIAPYRLADDRALDTDDQLLRETCAELGADLFISTYFTRAPGVRNIIIIHDLIPELMGYDRAQPEWRSKIRAIETADGFAAISQCTLEDLKQHYPQTVARPIQKMHLGIDKPFGLVEENRIAQLRTRYNLPAVYLLMVGNRQQYKNSAAMWGSMQDGRWDSQVHMLCVGGEKNLTTEERQLVQAGRVFFIPRLEDEELAAAYAGASALVCLSRYEGFGLPVLEAMACGCPVIATANGSLPEVAGEAALFVDADNSNELLKAIDDVRQPEIRSDLIAKGYAQANRFNWQNAGAAMTALIHQVRKQPPALVSAIVSTYNSERFIRGCLEDLLAQTIVDRLEIIVIDSASAQNEGSVVREFQARCSRVKYVRTLARESVYGAWNRGIKLAKGKYVTNANTDDRHRPDAFEKMAAVLEADSKTALVYADVIKTGTPNQTMAACTPTGVLRWFDWRRERLLTQGCFIGPQPMWRRNVHDVFGFFDERMTVAADYEFWLRISQAFDFRHLAEPLGLYLERADSVEHAHGQSKRAEERTIHERYSHAAASGKILDFAPFERLRRAIQCRDPIGMQRAVTDIQWVAQSASDAVAAGVGALCNDLSTILKPDAAPSEDRLERFIQRVSHYFLTRGAAFSEDAKRANDREANREKQKVDASKVLRDRSQKGVPMMQLADKIQQGVRCLLDSGHVEASQWVLGKLLTDYPGHGPAHHEQAMLAHHQGDVSRAGLHFKKAAELAPDNPVFQKSLGDFYHVAQKNTDAALVQYQKVLVLTPNDLETLLITGHLSTACHRFDEARTYYQKVLRLVPDHPDARQMLDRLSMKQAATQSTVSPEVLYQSACRQVEQGQRQEAVRTLERVIALDSRHAIAHNDLGVLAFEGGDKDKAQGHYEKACELAPYNGVFQKNLGDFYFLERGDAEKALTRYVQALTLDPQDVESLMATGHICMALKRLDDARVFFTRVLELEPWHALAQQYLKKLEASLASADISQPAHDLNVVAQSQATAGDLRGAIQTLEQLVGRDPNHAQAYNDLGVLHYEQGDKGQALRFYEQAVRLAPHDPIFLKNLADFYFVEQGRTQEALRIYIQILESNREDLECLMAAGTICLSLDKSGDARAFFERILEIDHWHAEARESLNRIQNESSTVYGGHIATLGQKRA